MNVNEQNVLIRAKDASGDSFIIYPITKADNVDGLDEAFASLSVQGDWNQTDPTAKDYIKNRFIYKDIIADAVTIASGTLPATEDADASVLTIANESFTGFVEGESYQVTVDGVTRECTGQFVLELGLAIIASFDIADMYAGSVTDGWFSLYMDGELLAIAFGSYLGKTISIAGSIYNIKKLPADLLPDSVLTMTEMRDYVDYETASTLSSAKSYVNSETASTLSSAKSYADSGDTSTLSSAKSYADSGDTSTLSSAKSYADSGDTSTLSSAKSYADSGDTTTLKSAKTYSDSGDATTLTSAKKYTDEQLAGLSQIQFITWGTDD